MSRGRFLLWLPSGRPDSSWESSQGCLLRLAAGGRGALSIPVNGAGSGNARIDLVLSGQGIRASQSYNLNVQPGSSDLFRRTVRPIPPGTNVTISGDLLADFIPGTGEQLQKIVAGTAAVSPAVVERLQKILQH